MALLLSPVANQFRFNVEAQRFVASNGQFVAREAVQASVQLVAEQIRRDVETNALRFQAGQISQAAWDAGQRLLLRRGFVAEAILAAGGADQMTPAKWGRVGALLREQYKYLGGFNQRIQAGVYGPDLQSNGFVANAKQYANAPRVAYERMQAANHFDELGHDEVANVYGGNEIHCEGDESCREMESLGFVSPDHPRWRWPGDRLCVNNDRCGVKTRKKPN